MKTENEPEPSWAGLTETIMNGIVIAFFFIGFIPVIVIMLCEFIHTYFFESKFPVEAYLYIVALPIGLSSLGLTLRRIPCTRTIKPGMVQFIQCMIPGVKKVYKLGKGWHLILPIYQDWKKAWSYVEKWTVELQKYRVTTRDFDVFVTGVATIRPVEDHLLPLHLLSNDHDKPDSKEECREYRVIKNMNFVLEKVAEKVIGEETKLIPGGTSKQIDTAEDVILESDDIEQKLKEQLGDQSIVQQHGVVFDTFSLGDINSPTDVEKRRDASRASRHMNEQAKAIVDDAGANSGFTHQQALESIQLVSQDISRTMNTETTQVDGTTLDKVGKIAETLLTIFLSSKGQTTTPTQTTPAITTIVINGLNGNSTN